MSSIISIGVCGSALVFYNNLFNHVVTCVVARRAMYSASVVDNATIGCFLLNQSMASPDVINRFPVVVSVVHI